MKVADPSGTIPPFCKEGDTKCCADVYADWEGTTSDEGDGKPICPTGMQIMTGTDGKMCTNCGLENLACCGALAEGELGVCFDGNICHQETSESSQCISCGDVASGARVACEEQPFGKPVCGHDDANMEPVSPVPRQLCPTFNFSPISDTPTND